MQLIKEIPKKLNNNENIKEAFINLNNRIIKKTSEVIPELKTVALKEEEQTPKQNTHGIIHLGEKDKELKLLLTEHDHGFLFKENKRKYSEVISNDIVNPISEECPCCIGYLALDEGASLTKVSAFNEHEFNPSHINEMPINGMQWSMTILGGYFALAGLYFGYENFVIGHSKSKKISKDIEKINLILDSNEDKFTKIEKKNLHFFNKSLEKSKYNSKFEKWVSGATPLVGSALMLGSFVYAPLTIPSLALMSGYGLGHVIKNSYDLNMLNKIDLNKIKNKDNQFANEGLEVFKDRVSRKKTYHKKMIPCWIGYTAGTSLLATTALLGILGVLFPLALVGVAIALILAGVAGTLYFNNKGSREFASRDKIRVYRQFLGDEKAILSRINATDKQLKLLQKFYNDVKLEFKKEMPKENIKLAIKKAGYYLGVGITLGIPNIFKKLNHSIKDKYSKYIESPQMADNTRNARLDYFSDSLKIYIYYLQNILENADKTDVSFMKRFVPKISELTPESINISRENFKSIIKLEIEQKKDLFNRFEFSKKEEDPVKDFENMWIFLKNYGMLNKVFEKVFNEVNKQKNIELFKDSDLICYRENSNCENSNEITFNKEKFIEQLKNRGEIASKLNNIILMQINHTLMYNLEYDLMDQKSEICGHLEQILRSEENFKL